MDTKVEEPSRKRAKAVDVVDGVMEDVADRQSMTTLMIDTAWDHYRNYMDDDDDGEGETDELVELLHVLGTSAVSPGTYTLTTTAIVTSRVQLLPVLISVASTVLAHELIAELLQQNATGATDDAESKERTSQIHEHLQRALLYFPENAATWSVASNYVRMMKLMPPSQPQQLAAYYRHAAECATRTRTTAVVLLANDTVPNDCKEWIELLLLHQVAGVELLEAANDTDEETDEETEEWSASTVEGTVRFMAAMLSSMAGNHDAAAQQLQRFGITHRLHPQLWERAVAKDVAGTESVAVPTLQQQLLAAPVAFQSPSGVLPASLYQRMCEVFHPSADYWKESDYAGRGYYSYYMDLPSPTTGSDFGSAPTNLIDDVVIHHLLPLAQQQQQLLQAGGNNHSDKTTTTTTTTTAITEPIVGYEWWVHTRPVAANLGHNLHFDTDEAGLAQDQTIDHPVLSSVLYLTGGGSNSGSGATIVLDQTPDSPQNATSAWYSPPVDNSFMAFPGNLLHGVLPCLGTTTTRAAPHDNDDDAGGVSSSDPEYLRASLIALFGTRGDEDKRNKCPTPSMDATPHRLTFMVGFWTRRVPDRIKEQKLYGPCGSLPPAATWVRAIREGYSATDLSYRKTSEKSLRDKIVPILLPSVSPAWEELPITQPTSEPLLQIPRAIDHRFFVINAPRCFRDSLFEQDEFDDPNLGDDREQSE